MTPSQAPSEKCSKCGEINSQKLLTCNLCGSVLPWVEAKRAAEAAERNSQTTRQKPQKTLQAQSKLGADRQRIHTKPSGFLSLLRRFPTYNGTETPTISLGDMELSLSHTAAFLGGILLALSVFAPLLNAIITSINLITVFPWLAWGNLLGATVAGVALVRDQVRWCYLSAFLGAIAVGVMGLNMAQAPSDLISPWRLLQWGVLPLVLGPLVCLVAAYFVGVPEIEDTEAANPFGHDQATLFQTRLYHRLKELTPTQVLQQANREDSEGMKAQLQQLRGLTSWAQVPEVTKRLLEKAEAELADGWALATISHANTITSQDEKAPKWVWGLGASVPVAVILFFVVGHFLKPKPIERDMGFLPRHEWRAKYPNEIGAEMLDYLDKVRAENPNAPSYALNATTQVIQDNSGRAFLKVVYTPEKRDIVITLGLVDYPDSTRSFTLSDIDPENIESVAEDFHNHIKTDILEKQMESARRDFQDSERDLKDRLDNLGAGLR